MECVYKSKISRQLMGLTHSLQNFHLEFCQFELTRQLNSL